MTAGFDALVHFAEEFAVVGTAAANFRADAAGEVVEVGPGEHEVGAGLADFGTVQHEAEVYGLDMFAAHFEAVIHRRLEAHAMAEEAVLDALGEFGR